VRPYHGIDLGACAIMDRLAAHAHAFDVAEARHRACLRAGRLDEAREHLDAANRAAEAFRRCARALENGQAARVSA
jgi:hypothetical protein